MESFAPVGVVTRCWSTVYSRIAYPNPSARYHPNPLDVSLELTTCPSFARATAVPDVHRQMPSRSCSLEFRSTPGPRGIGSSVSPGTSGRHIPTAHPNRVCPSAHPCSVCVQNVQRRTLRRGNDTKVRKLSDNGSESNF